MAFLEKLNQSGNVLLQKDNIGKAKPPTRILPPADWTYGLPDKKDKEGVRERNSHTVTYIWSEHCKTAETEPDRDFRALNKMSVRNRFTSAKAQREFRKSHEAFIPRTYARRQQFVAPTDKTYGIPTLRSDPMDLVLTNTFANLAEEEISQIYSSRFSNGKRAANARVSLSGSPGKRKAQEMATKELFKMKKFKRVQPRTNTNRGNRLKGDSQ